MAALRGLAGIAAVAALFQCAFAATITVGAPNGAWDQTTDLKTWAASQKFTAGDTLVFKYSSNHNVLEVSKADFDACRASSPISSYTGGNTAIPLPAAVKRYFICGTPGHCEGGMKIEVDVSAASAPPPTSPATPPPTAPATPPPKSAPSPSTPKNSRPPTLSPRAAAPSPASRKTSPSPSNPPEPATPVPSGSPPLSTPNSPSPAAGSPPQVPRSAAGGLKASAAAGFLSGLLILLAF